MRQVTIRALTVGIAATLLVAGSASAQQKVKIGFITTLSGPQGVIGEAMKNSVELALDHLGRKMGGLPVEMFYGDDQFKPDVGVQVAQEMMTRQQVDFVSGIIWSNIMMAVSPTVTSAGKIMVGTNAGPSPLAGAQCNKLHINVSWQNDQTPEAMGKYMTDSGINDVYIMAPNYQAGKDMLTGFKRYFKGRIVDEVYTKMGQSDYQAELSQLRAKKPKVVFVFYPGGMGISFLRQYSEAGLRGQFPLYSVYTVDELTIPAVKHAALGQWETRFWSPDLKNAANQKYVADYRKKYGKWPVFYGAQSYDGIMLIDSAVRAVKGNLKDTDALIRAMRKADFNSIRGKFSFNINNSPIENFYLLKAVAGPAGQDPVMEIQKTVFTNHKDAYYKECKLKW
jgi:branched-chain amino acid transport system substrate-binding protein